MYCILPLIFVSALAAGPQFDVQLLDGSRVSGSLARWDAATLVVETLTGPTTLDVTKLASLALQSPPVDSVPKPAVWVDLVDGSRLAAGEYSVEKGRARIAFSAAEVMVVPTAEIDAVRFRPASDATALEWSKIRGMKIRSDVLATGSSDAVDYHEGAIEDVTDKQVRFTLEGRTKVSEVKRAKVFGLIYYHAVPTGYPLGASEASYSIIDAAGSRWVAASLKLAEGKIEFRTPGGKIVRRGLDQIAKIDLSCGKIVYLSDLKPDSETSTPFPFTATGKEFASRLEFSRVRRDQNLESKTLRIDGQVYHRGLALRSRSELAWTLPGKFSRLEGVAGIDDDVRPLGNVRLQVLGDGKTLLDTAVSGNDKGATPILLDVSSVRRLVLIVDTQGNFGAGDYLDLGNLRLIK